MERRRRLPIASNFPKFQKKVKIEKKPKVMVLGVEKSAPKTQPQRNMDFTNSSTSNREQKYVTVHNGTPEFIQTGEQSIPTVTNAQDIPDTLAQSDKVNLKVQRGDKEIDIVYQATSSVQQGNKRMRNIRSKLRSKRT